MDRNRRKPTLSIVSTWLDITGCTMGACKVKVCRICFVTDCQLYHLHENKHLYKGYEAITGLLLADEEDLPPYLCSSCADQLMNCARFRHRSLQAHSVLLDVLKKHDHISVESIQAFIKQTGTQSHIERGDEIILGDVKIEIELEDNPIDVVARQLRDEIKNECARDDVGGDNDETVAPCVMGINNVAKGGVIDEAAVNNDVVKEKVIHETPVKKNMVKKKVIDETAVKRYIVKKKVIDETAVNNDVVKKKVIDETAVNNDVVKEKVLNETPVKKYILKKKVIDEAAVNNEVVKETVFHEIPVKKNIVKKKVTDETAVNNDVVKEKVIDETAVNNDVEDDVFDEESVNYDMLEEVIDEESLMDVDDRELGTDQDPLEDGPSRQENKLNTIVEKKLVKVVVYPNQMKVNQRSAELNKKLSDNVKFPCSICGHVNDTRIQFLTHLRAHSASLLRHNSKTTATGERGFSCDTCGKSFSTKRCLIRHSSLPFTCQVCHTQCQCQSALDSHMLCHSGVKSHLCDVCGKWFRTRSQLNSHNLVHTKEKPYSCVVCGKSFSRKKYVNDHMHVHTGSSSFKCEICGTYYADRIILQRHMLIH